MTKPTIAALTRKHGFNPSKRFGQNLLTDVNILNKIADATESGPGDTVLEIGPGFGTLTSCLSDRAGKVIAIEVDRRLKPILEESLNGRSNIEIRWEDFMRCDLSALPAGYKVAANLPYYITTPIIMKLLEEENSPALMVFMIQKEVAERLSARPGGGEYGAITVMAQYHGRIECLMGVSREVFWPKPKVDSAVIRIRPYGAEDGSGIARAKSGTVFREVVRAAFSQRRKMLRNALGVLGLSREALEASFSEAGVEPTARAETLSVETFVALADAVEERRESD